VSVFVVWQSIRSVSGSFAVWFAGAERPGNCWPVMTIGSVSRAGGAVGSGSWVEEPGVGSGVWASEGTATSSAATAAAIPPGTASLLAIPAREDRPARARGRRLLDDGDRVARVDSPALGHVQLLDLAGGRRGDLVLHLHRLDHADQGALVDLGALLHGHLEHGALKRRDQRPRSAAPAAAALAALGGLAGRGGRAAVDPARAERGPDDLDVEPPAGHLDRVLALDRRLLLLGLR